ncbi:tyrosine-type recombinase/integrase [Pseudotabrizicola alkalilacus]|uniref:Site-specific integrase n=1 Tax=Pseudotabrizicola alkalilacus TaxID=2305252 RepID=A0A411Z8B6_9RHOB|nr:site-specific integrase [Pseudotabrizicola alkalilacus]RGP39242.1 site-specific integrase [Pseudotabrizicola alkalilacus]
MGLLTVPEVTNAKVDGDKAFKIMTDGHGLYLRVGAPHRVRGGLVQKYWIAKMMFNGSRVEVGIGSAHEISLREAREANEALRVNARNGIDPRTRKVIADPKGVPTFAEAVDLYLKEKLKEFSNPKHVQQWQNTLKDYACTPKGGAGLGTKPVDTITADDVARVLKPIWAIKTETASRVRGRIEQVLAWATVKHHRKGENPARWKGNLEFLLAKPGAIKKVGHHEALPYQALPAFMKDLAGRDTVSALALQWLILTGVRSSEGRGALWSEVDQEAGVWTIPADRMKMKVPHRVPLSAQALAVAKKAKGLSDTFLFTTGTGPVSEAALRKLVKETLKQPDLTLHGFRTTLRMWMQDAGTDYEVAETVLAHKVGSDVAQAYARGDYLERRRGVMQTYANYACGQASVKDS